MSHVDGITRRQLLQGAAVVGGSAATGALWTPTRAAFAQGRDRPQIPLGVQSGDVRATSAVIWSKTDRAARMLVEVAATPGFNGRTMRWALDVGPDTDFTGKLELAGLPAGTELFYRVQFAERGNAGLRGEPMTGSLRTAPTDRRDVSFVWSGDVAGQGWGSNPDVGGMIGFEAVRQLDPDFFLHCGDTVYADGPLQEKISLPDGRVWHNVVTPEKTKVAQTLADYRGQYRYNLLDANVRRMAAQIPQLVQWDDHEVTNNWYPGEVLDSTGGDARYSEKRVDVLAARSRRAFFEYLPIGGTTIDRTVAYGPLVEVFLLDMRSFKSPNNANTGTDPASTRLLGAEQLDRTIRQMRESKALWKVVAADLPIGLVVPDGPVDQEGVANRHQGAPLGRELEIARLLTGLKRDKVKNVVFFTADVHYTAAHFYDPDKAAFQDFDPFWEFVSGPLNAGTFGPNVLNATFGPQLMFQRTADTPNQSPLDGLQFLGRTRIDGGSGVMSVELRDIGGTVLFTQDLTPQH
ncbi:MAG: alkaline phosphatase D family protein [Frankiales bacterium]|nr:alkaline phosphatase D family protein [Frankiales bacterium]